MHHFIVRDAEVVLIMTGNPLGSPHATDNGTLGVLLENRRDMFRLGSSSRNIYDQDGILREVSFHIMPVQLLCRTQTMGKHVAGRPPNYVNPNPMQSRRD